MVPLARRGLLKLMFGVGAAAACGLSIPGPAEAVGAAADAPGSAAETVESEFVPTRFRRRRRVFFVRRRRRRVFFIRRRPRRVYFIRRRPRRYYVVRRRRFW